LVYQYIVKERIKTEIALKTVYEHQDVKHIQILTTERTNFGLTEKGLSFSEKSDELTYLDLPLENTRWINYSED